MKVAVVVPLFLDSAFNNYDYKLGGLNIPKYFLPGLEFYNGVMAALDTMQQEGLELDVWIFDSKKKDVSLDSLASVIASMDFSMIVASFTNPSEQKIFSQLSLNRNIPLISATYPNDLYVVDNPFFVMINSTLKTHIEAIYKYIQRKYPSGKLVYVSRQGSLEDKIMAMFTDVSKKTYPLQFNTVKMPDGFTGEDLVPLLDSNRQNVILCGSVNEKFGTTLLTVLNDAPPSYSTVAVGMPTWDGLRAVRSATNENLHIVYSTPYNYPESDSAISSLSIAYKNKFNGRPSDMFFKGFETMFSFSRLLLKYHNDFLNNLSDSSFSITDGCRFEPVDNNGNSIPDYIENKNLYFIDISGGVIKSVN